MLSCLVLSHAVYLINFLSVLVFFVSPTIFPEHEPVKVRLIVLACFSNKSNRKMADFFGSNVQPTFLHGHSLLGAVSHSVVI